MKKVEPGCTVHGKLLNWPNFHPIGECRRRPMRRPWSFDWTSRPMAPLSWRFSALEYSTGPPLPYSARGDSFCGIGGVPAANLNQPLPYPYPCHKSRLEGVRTSFVQICAVHAGILVASEAAIPRATTPCDPCVHTCGVRANAFGGSHESPATPTSHAAAVSRNLTTLSISTTLKTTTRPVMGRLASLGLATSCAACCSSCCLAGLSCSSRLSSLQSMHVM